MRLALAILALSALGCATIPLPPVPQGHVTADEILAYQDALSEAKHQREQQRIRRAVWAVRIGTIADTATTIYCVHNIPGCEEANPLLPDPRDKTVWFIGVQLGTDIAFESAARHGYTREAWIYAIVKSAVALHNIHTMVTR